MTDWDEVVCGAVREAVSAVVRGPGQDEPGERRHLQPTLVAALGAGFNGLIATDGVIASLPDWEPLPGGVDVLIIQPQSPSPVVGIELKCNHLDQTPYDIFKMASLRRMPAVAATYVVAADRESRFSGATAGATLFNAQVGVAQDWQSVYLISEWPTAWERTLRQSSGCPTRVPRTLSLHLVCVCTIPAFPGWQVRAMRVEPEEGHGWLVLDEGQPSHLDPDPYQGDWPSQIPDADLTPDDLPSPDADEDAFHRFALTMDGYAREGTLERCATIANEAKERWRETGELPHDLRALRSCLFFEQRRAHHTGYPFDERTFAYVRALVEEMRRRLC